MSSSDRPTIPPLKALGCIAYGVIATCAVVVMFMGAAMSDCAPEVDGAACENDGFVRFLMFPGSFIAALAIGLLMSRWALRNDDHD